MSDKVLTLIDAREGYNPLPSEIRHYPEGKTVPGQVIHRIQHS